MNKRLIRFDVRLEKDDYMGTFWGEERRNRFLLQPRIEWPLSVDPLVWPSIFFSEIFRQATPYGMIEVDPSVDDGDYWLDLAQMTAHYEAHRRPNTTGIFVAIQLFSEKSLTEDVIPYDDKYRCALFLSRTTPSELPAGGELLGHDVADSSWISGLTNCAYQPDEKRQLAPIWGSRLNSFGLLTSIDDAIEFRTACDKRVPEHAPFWVYGISRLSLTH